MNAASFRESVFLVAGREVTQRLRSKSFIISTLILFAIVLGSILVTGFIARTASDTPVAAVGAASDVVADLPGYELVEADTIADAEQLVRDGEVDAAVVSLEGDAAVPFEVVALDEAPGGIVAALSIAPDIRLLEEPSLPYGLLSLVAFGFGLVFLMSAITFGGTIAQSVVEEKQTRVVEILLSAISARALLAGKVVGNSILAFGQIIAIAGLAALGLVLTGQDVLAADLGPAVGWFIALFAVGFVLLAAMFASSASLVSRMEDTGAVLTPVTYLVMIPYFLVVFFFDNSVALTTMSYVPFSAPVAMPMRIFLEQAQWWEPLLSLAVLAVTAVIVVALGARIYENSLLRTGARVKLSEALKG
ncbi:ABC-2 type transport system permease protein [Microcella putealis]|uniref:ABC-2 type transport system permease protein n=1 Tax=Microcella putealis TaxID=337005 RepID=A0A4Q7LQH2_9MICO|nr:ABC transporter permease [Microcella putealis]RZS56158.1 ABC-2 type transport system permease protein [Microcella putealis]TQM23411.1 ABC-2 type transport system permease protein [Microcella putealis]